ncbi:MAG: DUF916 domain-containing protein, partial [Bifidobacteriaceae bacterium]|nr:DUF916 domain-containing protein [Bifidobacteriaceae bacterium]
MRRGLTSVASVVAALAAATAINAPAAADDDAVTWMVRPSDGVGEDGRSWIELELAPGERVEEHLMVRNLSPAAVTFRLTAADGYFTDGGGFNMLTADDESVGAGTWITIPESVEVESGQAAIVPFTVEAPDNATPGDHAAGVAASIRTGGDDVGIESRVGFRVLTRVKGELAPRVEASVGGGYEGAANPFKPGRVEVAYTLADAGNTRLSIQPDVRVSAIFGLVSFSAPGDAVAEIGPGQSRTGSVEIPAAWPLGVYSVEVTANASTVGAGAAPEPVA